jgi:hypothetical protein
MTVTGPERLALHAAARGALGPEEGDTLMAGPPPGEHRHRDAAGTGAGRGRTAP